MNRSTLIAYPSQERLAREVDYSKRQVQRFLDQACAKGFLCRRREKMSKGNGRSGICNVYEGLFPAPAEPPESRPRDAGVSPATDHSARNNRGDDLESFWPEADRLVRRHLWLSDDPPPVPRGWHSGREKSVWRQLAREYGPEVVQAALPVVREVYALNGQPATLALLNARGSRGKLNELMHVGRTRVQEHHHVAGPEKAVAELVRDL